MNILKRHTKSTFLLGIYFLWWSFIIFYCFSIIKHITPVCDFSSIAIVFISFLLGLIYALGFLIKSYTTREPYRTDYLIFLGIITLPLVIGGFYVISNF